MAGFRYRLYSTEGDEPTLTGGHQAGAAAHTQTHHYEGTQDGRSLRRVTCGTEKPGWQRSQTDRPAESSQSPERANGSGEINAGCPAGSPYSPSAPSNSLPVARSVEKRVGCVNSVVHHKHSICRQDRVYAPPHARTINKLGRELYDRVGVFVGHFAEVGRSLDTAVGAHNQALGSLETRLLVTAWKFPEHGVSADELADTPQIERTPLTLSAPETPGLELQSRDDVIALPRADTDADEAPR